MTQPAPQPIEGDGRPLATVRWCRIRQPGWYWRMHWQLGRVRWEIEAGPFASEANAKHEVDMIARVHSVKVVWHERGN